MVFSSDGVLRAEDGSALARAEPASAAGAARLTVAGRSYEIVPRETMRTSFRLIEAGSRPIYEFHPGLRRGGIVALPSGEPAAQLVKPWIGRGWRIVPAAGEQIVVRRQRGLAGPVLVGNGELAPPALDLALPASTAPDEDLQRLLAFCCWLIAGWEARIPRMPAV